jgi:hypothetical protein
MSDMDAILEMLRMAGEGIKSLEEQMAELQADVHASRMLIGALLLHSPGGRDDAARLHATAEEWTLPFALCDEQRERLRTTLGRTLEAVRLILEKQPRPPG